MSNQSASSFGVTPQHPVPIRRRTALIRRPLAFYFAGVFVYAALTSVWEVEPVPLGVHAMAVVIAATCLVPIVRWYARGSQGLPMFELICLSYALQFSLPVFMQPNSVLILNSAVYFGWDTILEVLLLVELGMAMLIFGYYIVQRSLVVKRLPRLDLPLDPRRQSVYLLGALIGGGLVTLLQAMNWPPLENPAVAAIARLFANQLNLVIILLAYAAYDTPQRRARTVLLLWISVAVAFVVGLTTGLLENALLPLAFVIAVRWHVTRRLPWLIIVLGAVLYLVLNPAKFDYRQEVWYGGQDYTLGQRVGLWADVASESAATLVNPETAQERQDNFREALARFDLVHKFAWVRELTPLVQPYYLGETYTYFLYSAVPRALWPDKPVASMANERIDLDYGLRLESQRSTIGIGQLPEAYANFGALGIVLVMVLQGVVFALLDNTLNGPQSEGGRAIYLSVMVYFLNGIGSSAAVLFGALLQQVLANALILRLFARGFQASEPGASDVLPGSGPTPRHIGRHPVARRNGTSSLG